MAEANGHDVPRGQVRGRSADDFNTPEYKRQKSERTILAGRLGDVQLEGNGTEEEGNENGNHQSEEVTCPLDEIDGAARTFQGFVEDSLNVITRGKLSPQVCVFSPFNTQVRLGKGERRAPFQQVASRTPRYINHDIGSMY